MAERASVAIDEFLLTCVEDLLSVPRGELDRQGDVAKAMRATLAEESLSEREQTIVATVGAGAESADGVIAARLERALEAGCTAARAPDRAPRVVVARTGSPSSRKLEDTLGATLAPPVATLDSKPSQDGRPALVLADEPAYREMQRLSKAPADAPRKWTLSFEGEKKPATPSPAPGAEVRLLPGTIVDLEATLTGAAKNVSMPARSIGRAGDGGSLVGRVLGGKYKIVRLIAKGGFGAVYEATDEKLDSRVAIKVLKAQHGGDESGFREEAQRITKISHPNVVDWKVFDQTEDGLWYFVMEYLEGESLEGLLKREGKLPWKRAARILVQVLGSLRAAHDLGEGESILHLDLKPNNVFLIAKKNESDPDRVKVFDFGIGQHIVRGDVAAVTPGAAATTKPGAAPIKRCQGLTPEYASPEQCAHLVPHAPVVALDGRSDLYSFGVMAFQMLTGRLPYEPPKNRAEWLTIHREVAPTKVLDAGKKIPRRLARFVERCLVKDRDGRWPSADAALRELDAIVNPPAWKVAAPVAVPAVVLVGVGVWLFGPAPEPPAFDVIGKSSATSDAMSILNQPIYFGPKRADATLSARDVARSDAPGPIEIVATDASGTEAPLGGWKAAWSGEHDVRIDAPAIAGRVDETVRLKCTRSNGKPWHSVSFKLVGLGPDAWTIDSLAVEGLASTETAIDPKGQSLVLRVRGPKLAADAFAIASFAPGDATVKEPRPSAKPDVLEWAVGLDRLKLESGTDEIVVRIVDRAGREETAKLSAKIELEPLAILEASLQVSNDGKSYVDCVKDGDAFVFYPGSEPRLRVRTSRRADVQWNVLGPQREALKSGDQPAPAEGLELAIPLSALRELKGGEGFSGRIEVKANESRFVEHLTRTDAQATTPNVQFTYVTDKPGFSVRRAGATSDVARGVPVFTNAPKLDLRVTRESTAFIWASATATRRGAPASPAARQPWPMNDPSSRWKDVSLDLPEDGVYDVEICGGRWRMNEDEKEAPSQTLTLEVVRDSRKKTLSLKPTSEGALLVPPSGETPEIALAVAVADEPALAAVATPLAISWSLEHLGTHETVDVTEAVASSRLEAYDERRVRVPRPKRAGADGDGTYRLEVTGHDEAGNLLEAGAIEIVVANEKPMIEVSRPERDKEWPPVSRRFPVKVITHDWNAVTAVRARVALADGKGPSSETLSLKSEPANRDTILWSGELELDHTWSDKSVDVAVEAVPSAGDPNTATVHCRLPYFEPEWPPSVEARFIDGRAAPTQRMRVVAGNHGFEYVFGGRAQTNEDALFDRAGLYPYDDPDRPMADGKSWMLTLPKDAIATYYLDECEVTCAEYRTFVRAADGYADARWWPNGLPAAAAERRAELEKKLAASPDDRPVTGVDWDEANAYALWTGKRLPTRVEWEFAVRGERYRPYSWFRDGASPGVKRPDPNAVEPPSVRDGNDETPDTKIRNLCSNVAEWTSTPVSFSTDGDAKSARAQAAEHVDAMLDPSAWTHGATYWVVGGTFDGARFDFSDAHTYGRPDRFGNIGFRCAISALRALPGAASPSDRVRIVRVDKP